MLELRRIRDDANGVKTLLATRNKNYDSVIDAILKLDAQRREVIGLCEGKKARQNIVSKEVAVIKKEKGDAEGLMSEMRQLSEVIKQEQSAISAIDTEMEALLYELPNTPNSTVPIGKDANENIEVRKHGTPRQFDFEPLAHWEIGKNLDILDPERAAKVTGTRFHFYKGLGARLERAIINFYLDTHTALHGYTEILPPFIANAESMKGTGQLPKFKEDMFALAGSDYYLIPTAEVPVTNFHRDEVIMAAELPKKYCAYSACFRAEAGAAGRDSRGLIRQHQFNKVELVKFCHPHNSYAELEALTKDAEHCLELLGLPYRTVVLCTGDMGFSSAKTYDIEVWLPSYNRYAEISSCSNFEDFQARRMSIKYKNEIKDKAALLHTLNGSGLAVGRTTAAILENYQNKDGSVTVPEVLRKYMGGGDIRL